MQCKFVRFRNMKVTLVYMVLTTEEYLKFSKHD